MLRIPDSRIDQFIAEDVPYIDLTSEVLGIGAKRGEMEFFTREKSAGAKSQAREPTATSSRQARRSSSCAARRLICMRRGRCA